MFTKQGIKALTIQALRTELRLVRDWLSWPQDPENREILETYAGRLQQRFDEPGTTELKEIRQYEEDVVTRIRTGVPRTSSDDYVKRRKVRQKHCRMVDPQNMTTGSGPAYQREFHCSVELKEHDGYADSIIWDALSDVCTEGPRDRWKKPMLYKTFRHGDDLTNQQVRTAERYY